VLISKEKIPNPFPVPRSPFPRINDERKLNTEEPFLRKPKVKRFLSIVNCQLLIAPKSCFAFSRDAPLFFGNGKWGMGNCFFLLFDNNSPP
jgi:hypothetical protein